MDKPKIRFKGFEEAWRKRTLGEIAPLRGGFAFKSTEYAPSGIPIIRISNILSDGTIGAEFIYHQEDANDENYILHDGAALLAMSGATTGKVSILHCKKTDKYYQNQRVGYFQKVNGIDYKYISTITRSILFTQQLYNVLVAGAQPNISAKDVDNFRFYVAKDIAEQEKIGNLFERIDTLLNLQQRKCDKLKVIKKAMLSKMFPKPGKKAPEVRFQGFTDDWVECKLGEMCDYLKDGDWIESKDQSSKGIRLLQTSNIGITHFLDKGDKSKWISEESFKRMNCTEVYPGDILISRLPDPAGRACIVPKSKFKMITAVDCSILRTKQCYNRSFLVQYLSSDEYFKKVNDFLAGGTRQRISRKNLESILIPTTNNLSEQKQIGDFFHKLDSLIRLSELKLSKLRLIKGSLLEGMFV